jgi:hypothetical protein
VQLKGLTDVFCLLMSSYKVYKEDVSLWIFQIENNVPFEMSSKKLSLKGKT